MVHAGIIPVRTKVTKRRAQSPPPQPSPASGRGSKTNRAINGKCDESSTNFSRSREMPRHEQREVP